jgi:hypothetical protein
LTGSTASSDRELLTRANEVTNYAVRSPKSEDGRGRRSEDAGKEPDADAPVVTPPEVIRNPRERWVGEKDENSMAKRTSVRCTAA